MSDLAYWYIRNGRSLADITDVDDRLQKKLGDFKNLSQEMNGSAVRIGFVTRTGILREISTGKIDFPHRTFQEFLAAKQIVEERDFGVLSKNANDQQNWRETIILAAGLANQREAENLIKELLERYNKQKNVGILLLAVGCLETSICLSDSVKQAVEIGLQTIIPPKNITEAYDLAIAGDLVVPYLTNIEAYKAKETASCVHTLARIGTDTALLKLAEIAEKHKSQVVCNRLFIEISRWPDPAAYIDKLIVFRAKTTGESIVSWAYRDGKPLVGWEGMSRGERVTWETLHTFLEANLLIEFEQRKLDEIPLPKPSEQYIKFLRRIESLGWQRDSNKYWIPPEAS